MIAFHRYVYYIKYGTYRVDHTLWYIRSDVLLNLRSSLEHPLQCHLILQEKLVLFDVMSFVPQQFDEVSRPIRIRDEEYAEIGTPLIGRCQQYLVRRRRSIV